MGTEISVLCRNCEYERKFTLGVGMYYSSLDKIIDVVHYWNRERVLEILRNHKVTQSEYYHGLFLCLSCNQFHGRFYVRIEYDDDKIYETKFKCNKCKTELEPIEDEENVKNYPCPKCGEIELYIREDVLWD